MLSGVVQDLNFHEVYIFHDKYIANVGAREISLQSSSFSTKVSLVSISGAFQQVCRLESEQCFCIVLILADDHKVVMGGYYS